MTRTAPLRKESGKDGLRVQVNLVSRALPELKRYRCNILKDSAIMRHPFKSSVIVKVSTPVYGARPHMARMLANSPEIWRGREGEMETEGG